MPHVIYNVFPQPKTIKEKKTNKEFRLFWFSQTIGTGRGLEELISGLKKTDRKFSLHLLGNVNKVYQNKLIELSQNQFEINFYPIIGVNELQYFIAQFDLGLALELSHPESRNLTVTNKFFQYIQSGLPILASNTKGQKEIMLQHQIGALIKITDDKWHEQLLFIIDHPAHYHHLKQNVALVAAQYNWEVEQHKLLAIINRII